MNYCPECNSTDVAIYIYGYSGVGKFKKDVDAGKIVLGYHNKSEDRPDYQCNKCRFEWPTPKGENTCDTCLDVIMYCKCYKSVIKENDGK